MTAYVRFGAFCNGVDAFDASAFRVPKSEAATLDPQHRLLLEATSLALLDGGVDGTALTTGAVHYFGMPSVIHKILSKDGGAGVAGRHGASMAWRRPQVAFQSGDRMPFECDIIRNVRTMDAASLALLDGRIDGAAQTICRFPGPGASVQGSYMLYGSDAPGVIGQQHRRRCTDDSGASSLGTVVGLGEQTRHRAAGNTVQLFSLTDVCMSTSSRSEET